jgi:Fe-S oxidoreductase
MCPSFRVTHNERDVTRGRANTLRLAISGQLGPDAFMSDEMLETMSLCVSCKGCRRECPTGVDMARMKIEVLAARAGKRGYSLRDRLIGWLPRYAPYASKTPWLFNLRDAMPALARLSEAAAGFTAQRKLPRWRNDIFREPPAVLAPGREVVLFADTFNRYFERENLDAAVAVLEAGGYRVLFAKPANGGRALCCGRTFLAVGAVGEAKEEAERTLAALKPFLERGVSVVGLEPSCIFGFRDEIPALLQSDAAKRFAGQFLLFEEFLAREAKAGRFAPAMKAPARRALLHGHCHQKAFDAMSPVLQVLKLVPGLTVETVESSCCGMAGSFGYGADTFDISLAMGELSLLPAVRKATPDTIIVADGTSCREQIAHGTGREAVHVARVLAASVAAR